MNELPKLPPAPRMRNWLLKFDHPSGHSIAWFTVYGTEEEVPYLAEAIVQRTGYRYRYDYTEL